jgi:hypothetical protein
MLLKNMKAHLEIQIKYFSDKEASRANARATPLVTFEDTSLNGHIVIT